MQIQALNIANLLTGVNAPQVFGIVKVAAAILRVIVAIGVGQLRTHSFDVSIGKQEVGRV